MVDRTNECHHQQPNPRDSSGKSRATWLIPVGIIGLLAGAYFVIPSFQAFISKAYALLTNGDQEGFKNWVQGFGVWGPIVIILMMIMQTLLAFIPSIIIMVVGVLAYGPWWGGGLVWAGAMVAALVGYSIGRLIGPATVYKLIGKKTEDKVEGFVNDYGIWAIIAARISPALSTDAVSFVAGLVSMNVWKFTGATAAGILPLTVLIAYLGADFTRLQNGLIWVSVISMLLFIAYVIWDKKFRNNSNKN